MKNIFLITALILSLSINSQDLNNNTLSNAIRVKFENSISLPASQNNFVSAQGNLKIGSQTVDQLNQKFHATNMKRVFPYAGKFEEKHRKYGLHLWYDIFTEPGVTVEELKAQYESLQDVSIAEPISIYSHEDFKGAELDSNDPLLTDQWHYNNDGQSGGTLDADISLLEAWNSETGDSRVVVSVHDSGIDTDHPDLVNHLWINDGEIPNDNIDNDNNGFIDDYYGYNFAAAVVGGDPSSVEDYGGHGTHTSGTIAAENNNGVGIAGVAGGSGSGDGVRIMMMRLGDDNGSPYIYNPAPSFIYAADMGAVISSNSWGGGGYDQSIIDAIQYFTTEAGSSNGALDGGLAIFSSGNSSSNFPDYKADLDHLIMVSASNHNDQKAWYSNYGNWVDITAPGGETNSRQSEGVLSTLPGNSYGYYQGTSMACPHVSGVAALLVSKAYGSGLTNAQLEEALLSTADPIDQLNPNYTGSLGSGRLNAENALSAVSRGFGSSGKLLIDPIEIVTEINEGESDIFTVKVVNTNDYEIDVDIESTENWISPNAANISLAPNGVGKFTVDVNAANAGDLLEGQIRFSYISFNSNATSILPISVYTLGEPNISSIDTLNFGTHYIGYPTSQIVEITNDGTNYLTISEAESFTTDYGFDFSDTTLAPSTSLSLPIIFTPSQSGALIDSILFTSDDPNEPKHKIVLLGEGNTLLPPQLALNSEKINIQLPSAINGSGYFILTNDGDETLSYSVTSNPADIVPLDEYSSNYVNIENDQPVQNNGNYNGVGNLLSHQKNPVSIEQGLAWDGEYLWIKESTNSTIYRYDVDSQVVVDSIESIATSISRLDFYNGFLWEHDLNNQIIQYDLNGSIIAQIDLPEQYYFTQGIAVDQDGIWLNSGGQFIVLNYEGEIETQFNNYDAYGLEAIETIGSKIYGLRNGRVIVFTKFSIRDDFYSTYIGGHYQLNTSDIALDGESAWTSFIDYGVLVEFEPFENFINYSYPSSGNVSAGESINVNFEYNINSFMDGLNYNDVFRIYSNDLDNPVVDLPVSLLITGSPQINVSETQISFDSYVGYDAIDTITIRNDGAAPLIVSSVTSSLSDFTFSFSETELGQFESFDLPISVSLIDTDTLEAILQIVSNDADPEEDTINVSLSAIGRLAPEISIQPDSLVISLYESQIDSLPITITNSGDGSLFYSILNEPVNQSLSSIISKSETFSDGFVLDSKDDTVPPESISFYNSSSESISSDLTTDSFHQANFTNLEDVLSSLDENNEIITSVLDSRYLFRDGIYGNSISDGGGDMYDGGNRLSTDLGGYLEYSNSNIYSDQAYLGNESYFTAKYDGLFVFSADLEGVSSFSINGDLGADGSGSVDGSVLSFNYRGIEWLGFVKRVYNT
ncbi:MAG: S8 family serine peptidase, partial [Ekhidna sp.]